MYEILRASIRWKYTLTEGRKDGRSDGKTGVAKLIVAFRSCFTNTPKTQKKIGFNIESIYLRYLRFKGFYFMVYGH